MHLEFPENQQFDIKGFHQIRYVKANCNVKLLQQRSTSTQEEQYITTTGLLKVQCFQYQCHYKDCGARTQSKLS